MGTRGPVKGKSGRPTEASKRAKTRPRQTSPKVTDGELPLLDVLAAGLTWSQLVELAGQWRPLKPPDFAALRLLFDGLHRYRELSDFVNGLPLANWTGETDKGYVYPIPQISMLTKATDQLVTLLARFGMSPADRVRLGDVDTPEAEDDPFAAYMRKGLEVSEQAQAKKGRESVRRGTVRRPSAERQTPVRKARKASTPKAPARPKKR